MNSVLLLAKNILRVTFRKRSGFVIYILMPVLVVVLSFALTALPSGAIRIGVSNRDAGALGADVLQMLEGNRDFKLIPADSNDFGGMLENKDIDCGIVIPNDFTSSLQSDTSQSIDIVVTGDQMKSMPILQGILNVCEQNLRDLKLAVGGDEARFAKLFETYKTGSVSLDTVDAGDEAKSRNATANVVGFFVMFLMFGTSIVSGLILSEKTARTYFRIISAPVRSREFLLANMLTNFLIIAVQVALVIFVATVILGVEFFMPVWQFALVLLCFGLSSIGTGLLIVSLSRDSSQANSLQTLIIVPSSLLAGCFWPTAIMPDIMQKLSYLTPQRWVLLAVQSLQQGNSFAYVLPEIAVILAFAAAFFMIAAYRFSRNQDIKNVA
jgi:ABC-2 type transport system permease protein